MISDHEFDEWLEHPVTRAVREMLSKKREDIKELLATGHFTHETADKMAIDTAGAVGECTGLDFAATLMFEDYESEVLDGKPKRATPEGEGSVDSGMGA